MNWLSYRIRWLSIADEVVLSERNTQRVRNTLNKLKELNLTYDDVKDMDDASFDELFTKKPEEEKKT